MKNVWKECLPLFLLDKGGRPRGRFVGAEDEGCWFGSSPDFKVSEIVVGGKEGILGLDSEFDFRIDWGGGCCTKDANADDIDEFDEIIDDEFVEVVRIFKDSLLGFNSFESFIFRLVQQ